MTDDEMKAVFALRHVRARIMGVVDAREHKGAQIEDRYLGQAIAFIAQAPMDGFDVRAAVVLYGERGNESLRAQDCAQLWAKYGKTIAEN
ncbi:hypothetical protein [Mesorhizobium japonicum]|uniref:Msr0466 protein n=1 Tax=Mesorhizobium japonicum (strain LMG 29417 / CECT 9101 / MAFF 303099) TaxID=266835 RepID=Q98MR8_RHILO|nr:hypothetical protein [Mesorhizobium japonicum]BAB48045.1 msr0466 [Mesorhizobium japonicum MAFF 303099]